MENAGGTREKVKEIAKILETLDQAKIPQEKTPTNCKKIDKTAFIIKSFCSSKHTVMNIKNHSFKENIYKVHI